MLGNIVILNKNLFNGKYYYETVLQTFGFEVNTSLLHYLQHY